MSEVMTARRGTIVCVETSEVEVGALAINVTIPEALRWRDTRRDEELKLQSLTIRMLPDGTLAAKAYGRPVAGGRGAYVSFPVPDRPEIAALISAAADEAGRRWDPTAALCLDHSRAALPTGRCLQRRAVARQPARRRA